VNSVEWKGGFVLDAPLPRACMSAITRSEERSQRVGRKGKGWTRGKVAMILSVRDDSVFCVFDRDREGCPTRDFCKKACKIARMCRMMLWSRSATSRSITHTSTKAAQLPPWRVATPCVCTFVSFRQQTSRYFIRTGAEIDRARSVCHHDATFNEFRKQGLRDKETGAESG